MREPSIVVTNSYFNIVYDWAFEAADKNEPAAKLISIFRYQHDNPYSNRILVNLLERAMNKHRKHLRELGDWMPYSIDYLCEMLLYAHGANQVIVARKKLIDIGFISEDVPEDIKTFYSRSHSWYKFEVDNVKNWLNTTWFPMQKQQAILAAELGDVKEKISIVASKVKQIEINKVKEADKPETLTKQVNALIKFFLHIHAKNSRYIVDSARKNRVKIMLTKLTEQVSETRAVTMCAQAILGNVVSDFHQGRHPKNTLGVMSEETGNKGKIYDDLGDHIFKNAKKIDAMINHAEDAGITEDVAQSEFREFLNGKPSRYGKVEMKTAQRAANAKEAASKSVVEIAKEYRAFAREISAFFFTFVPNKEIMDMCQTNPALKKLGKGLTDDETLLACLKDAAKSFGDDNVTEKIANQMQEFVEKFCKIQRYN
jgi:hypothetical protein